MIQQKKHISASARLLVFASLVLFSTSGLEKLHAATQPSRPSAAKVKISRNPYLGAIAIDAVSGRVLFEDQADAKGYPASTLKLMDLLIVLEKIERKEISLQDQVTVSARAAKTGGSQVYLAEREVFSLEDLLYALMVQSANDCAVAIAEKVSGSTEAFVELMNKRAHELGMNNTVFHSVHGLPPGAGQEFDVTTARDFARLCQEILKHPDALRYTSTRERAFRPNAGPKTIIMRNHNHLLGKVEGCDGLKTGYITAAGYSIEATAIRNGKRVIVIVLDSADRLVRDAKAAELINKGFAALAPAASPVAPQPKQPSSIKRRAQ
ncbi:MAG TPA: D-alanyl-D-alanine carboxypeptidase family protein [Candidatus Saccharimonadales bacterium]|nr:D-alanyl-D-alanine carboxypeptidase family protein [Candidatus Saccharimonadales bacterium]